MTLVPSEHRLLAQNPDLARRVPSPVGRVTTCACKEICSGQLEWAKVSFCKY